MFGLGTVELVIIFAVILLLFGPKKLPDLAAGIAQGMKVFRKEIGKDKDEQFEKVKVQPQDKIKKDV